MEHRESNDSLPSGVSRDGGSSSAANLSAQNHVRATRSGSSQTYNLAPPSFVTPQALGSAKTQSSGLGQTSEEKSLASASGSTLSSVKEADQELLAREMMSSEGPADEYNSCVLQNQGLISPKNEASTGQQGLESAPSRAGEGALSERAKLAPAQRDHNTTPKFTSSENQTMTPSNNQSVLNSTPSNQLPPKRKHSKFLWVVIILLVIIIAGLVYYMLKGGGSAPAPYNGGASSQPAVTSDLEQASDKDVIAAANLGDNAREFGNGFDISKGFSPIVSYALPAVVNVSAVKTLSVPSLSFGNDMLTPFLKEFFKQFNMPTKKAKAISLGSGFIVRSDGFVVTNYHVIQGAGHIKITLHDGKTFPAVVYAVDPMTDLAVLKINATNLPALQFDDSTKVKVGDWVIAIGNPFGLGGTVSAGIVSARGRDINVGMYDEFIQTDAAINRGNSGGPMIDTRGKVIGVNTAIFSTSNGGSIGIGFAVPSSLVQNVVAQLITNKQVTRGWIGVQVQDVDEGMEKVLKLGDVSGAIVADVTADGPAGKAGLKVGDVISAVNGTKVLNRKGLPKLISMLKPGTVIHLTVITQGIEHTVAVTIGKLPSDLQNSAGVTQDEEDSKLDSYVMKETEFSKVGIKVAQINIDVKKLFNLPDASQGVIISAVAEGSVAEAKGISAGLIIKSVNGKKIATVADLKSALSMGSGQEVYLFLVEDPVRKANFFISLSPGKAGDDEED